MKLKASHYWLSDGRVVVEVRDHDAKKDMPKLNPFSGPGPGAYHNRKPQIATLVHSMIFPRGIAKADVKLAKKNAIMFYEIKMNEVTK